MEPEPVDDAQDPFMTDLKQRAEASHLSILRYLVIAEGEKHMLPEATKDKLREVAAGIYAASERYTASA